ncbi:putative ankyrin repeat-containing domain superfamily [Helianthus annuus]|nr:putative ankyrin repeat-containing domain superfamily [Helianthus annuus]
MVWKFFSTFASHAVSLIIEGRKDVLRKVTHGTHERGWLSKGNDLCKGKVIGTPMSTDLTKRVRDIYTKCKSSKDGKSSKGGDTPLMMAIDMGLMDMVWGFIECARQTNTNLETGQKGDGCVQEFFWLYNDKKQTAFDIAVKKGHVEVARLLLNNTHRWCFRCQWIRRREALLHLINHDPKFDGFIFDMLVTSTAVHGNVQRGKSARVHGNGQRGITM